MKMQADFLQSAETQALCALLEDAGHQAFLVGGCVRNSLMKQPVSDVDISTDARPDVVMALAAEADIKAVPTGIEHGTVTLVINKTPFEVTTFRKDIETDGRRAVVAFADDIESDARRRDFTVNALYARRDGTVIDPLGGLPDVKARLIRFIDDAEMRIQEDYLRILRFFRFYAWYGDPANGLDADGLAACAKLADGTVGLSKERVGSEILKILAARDPLAAVAAMRQSGVLSFVLPGADTTALGPLVAAEMTAVAAPDPVRRLTAIGGDRVSEMLRLSNKDAKRLEKLKLLAAGLHSPEELGYRHGFAMAQDALLLRFASLQEPYDTVCSESAKIGAEAEFPISSSDLIDQIQGKALGEHMTKLERLWIASGFELSRDDLLALSV